MKPEPFAFTSFASRIGSPATNGARTIMPVRFFKRFRTITLANEISCGGARRPGLPAHVGRRQRLTSGKIRFGHKNIDSIELGRLGLRRGRPIGSASQQCGNATCGQRDGQNYDTCSFHTLTLTMT